MMQIFLSLSTIFLLLIIASQDFRYKGISWYFFPFLLLLIILMGLHNISLYTWSWYLLINLLFIFLNLLFLTIYFSFKQKKIANIFNTYIGVGDILFFVISATYFSPFWFLLFFVSGLLLTLIVSLFYFAVTKNSSTLIPLAGAMALLLILFIGIKTFWHINFYNDQSLLELII